MSIFENIILVIYFVYHVFAGIGVVKYHEKFLGRDNAINDSEQPATFILLLLVFIWAPICIPPAFLFTFIKLKFFTKPPAPVAGPPIELPPEAQTGGVILRTGNAFADERINGIFDPVPQRHRPAPPPVLPTQDEDSYTRFGDWYKSTLKKE